MQTSELRIMRIQVSQWKVVKMGCRGAISSQSGRYEILPKAEDIQPTSLQQQRYGELASFSTCIIEFSKRNCQNRPFH
jgi:hypothetical protein